MPRGLGRGLGALIPVSPRPGGPGLASTDGATALRSSQPDAVDRWLLRGPVEGLPEDGADAGAAVPRGTDAAEPFGVRSGLHELPLDAITPNPRQPREVFDADALAELVASVREVGLLQPVVVRPTAENGRYELVMGERRWRAAREAGLDVVPAVVRQTDDADLLRDALLENLHRADLNPLEEAAAYQQLLSDGGCTQEELSRRIGRSRPQISNTLRLLRLTPGVQRRVAAGVLSAGHARALVTLDDPATQEAVAARTVAEGLSVRATEEIAAIGDADAAPRRRAPRRPDAGSADHDELAQRIGDRLDTRVAITGSAARGRIVIDFATGDDLHRIAGLITARPA